MTDISAEEIAAKQAELKAIEDALLAQGKAVVDTKPLYKSKMFWVQVLAIAGMVVDQFGNKYLSTEQFAVIVGGLLPMVNIVLRYLNKDISGVVN